MKPRHNLRPWFAAAHRTYGPQPSRAPHCLSPTNHLLLTAPRRATVTSENKDKEIERIQTVEGALPIGAAIAADAIVHSIPGLNVLFSLLLEPTGAAAGVAYMVGRRVGLTHDSFDANRHSSSQLRQASVLGQPLAVCDAFCDARPPHCPPR